MTIHRYGVVDANGVKINTITADDALVASGWYPGYGAALVDEGVNPSDPPPPPPPKKPATWTVLVASQPMSNGDIIDFKTGQVTVTTVEPILTIDPIIA